VTEPETPEPPEAVTAWHPLLVALLEIFLPAGWLLIPELYLSRLPQRVDIVILELVGEVPGSARRLHSIFDHLRRHTLIEHKGPRTISPPRTCWCSSGTARSTCGSRG
jgi:hypothetical protein